MGERRAGVQSEHWHEYSPGQRVLTREGLPGRVRAVEDGPSPGSEHYLVTLDAGLGGGEYSVGELSPLGDTTSSLAAVERVASDDYPELGTILSDRPPPALLVAASLLAEAEISEPDYAQPTGAGSDTCICCGGTGEHQNGRECARCDASGQESAAGPDDPVPCEGTAAAGPAGEPLCPQCGVPIEHDPQDGWQHADGSIGHWDDSDGSAPEAMQANAGYIRDLMTPPTAETSFDWCRFRRANHCWYPKELDRAASDRAGYAVWTPMDRGRCPRVSWQLQEQCPIGEPGPHAGGYTDATVPWNAGGQHGGQPSPGYRSASLRILDSDPAKDHAGGMTHSASSQPTATVEGNPSWVKGRIDFPTAEEAQAFHALLPRAVGAKQSFARERDGSQTWHVSFRADLTPNQSNQGVNEGGVRRYRGFRRALDRLGVPVQWEKTSLQTAMDEDEFERHIGGDAGMAASAAATRQPKHEYQVTIPETGEVRRVSTHRTYTHALVIHTSPTDPDRPGHHGVYAMTGSPELAEKAKAQEERKFAKNWSVAHQRPTFTIVPVDNPREAEPPIRGEAAGYRPRWGRLSATRLTQARQPNDPPWHVVVSPPSMVVRQTTCGRGLRGELEMDTPGDDGPGRPPRDGKTCPKCLASIEQAVTAAVAHSAGYSRERYGVTEESEQMPHPRGQHDLRHHLIHVHGYDRGDVGLHPRETHDRDHAKGAFEPPFQYYDTVKYHHHDEGDAGMAATAGKNTYRVALPGGGHAVRNSERPFTHAVVVYMPEGEPEQPREPGWSAFSWHGDEEAATAKARQMSRNFGAGWKFEVRPVVPPGVTAAFEPTDRHYELADAVLDAMKKHEDRPDWSPSELARKLRLPAGDGPRELYPVLEWMAEHQHLQGDGTGQRRRYSLTERDRYGLGTQAR